MLKKFEYIKPANLEQTLHILEDLKEKKVQVIAGGTDLIPLLRSRVKEVEYVVDLVNTGFNHITLAENEIRIGALTSFRNLTKNEIIKKKLPVLACAAGQVGAAQTRSLASIGGNICSAVPSLDSAPSLFVLGAILRLVSKGNERMVPIEKFFTGPRQTVLQPGEILAEIVIPLPGDNYRASFIKIGRRKALTLAIVNGAAGITFDENQEIINARIALGAVAPTPVRAYKAEEILFGKKASPELFAEAAAVAVKEIAPISDLRASAEYRRTLSEVLVRRALTAAWQEFTSKGAE